MGFFKDFKRDFAQAVNELMPDKDELANEYDDEDMVNTFDEDDIDMDMEIAPEDMLEDLDDFSIERNYNPGPDMSVINKSLFVEDEEEEYEEEIDSYEEDEYAQIPEAEVIAELKEEKNQDLTSEETADSVLGEVPDTVVVDTEKLQTKEETEEEKEEAPELDELKELDALDEDNMLEGTKDAVEVESPSKEKTVEDIKDSDLDKAVEAAILKHEEETVAPDEEESFKEESMAEITANIGNITDDKEQNQEGLLGEDTAYITKGTTIKGDILTEGGVDIIGTVEGNVNCGGKLIVGGNIKGTVQAGEVYANAAKLEGEVSSTGSVKIGVGTVVIGNVNATSAVIAGAVNGDIDVHGPVIVDSTAVIMGNIKSRSVQINNGAVIEGFCSQCYSEIDVKSFFE